MLFSVRSHIGEQAILKKQKSWTRLFIFIRILSLIIDNLSATFLMTKHVY